VLYSFTFHPFFSTTSSQSGPQQTGKIKLQKRPELGALLLKVGLKKDAVGRSCIAQSIGLPTPKHDNKG